MAFRRSPLPWFELENSAYVDATVTVYLVDSNGVRLDALASLYDDINGLGSLQNPFQLTSRGAQEFPVYVDQSVIVIVQGMAGNDTTGIFTPSISDDDVQIAVSAAEAAALSADQAEASAQAALDSAQDAAGFADDASASAAAAAASALQANPILVPSIFGSRPTIWLDFVTSPSLDPSLVFTRASLGTYTTRYGLLATAAVNVPRFDYDAATLAPRGVLLEGASSNIVPYSDNFGVWPTQFGTITAISGATGIDGSPSAWTITDTDAANTSRIFYSITNPIDTAWRTYSAYISAGNSTRFQHQVEAYSGAYQTQSVEINAPAFTVASGDGTILRAPGSFYRVSTGFLSNGSANTTVQADLYPATTGVGSVVITGAQIELLPFSTSLIRTNGATGTRAADAMSMVLDSTVINPAEGTLFLEADVLGIGANTFGVSRLLNLNGGSQEFINITMAQTGQVYFEFVSGGVVQASLTVPTVLAANQQFRVALSYRVGAATICVNGGAVYTGALPVIPVALTSMVIGNEPSQAYPMFGHCAHIGYFPKAFDGTLLQQMTATTRGLDVYDAESIVPAFIDLREDVQNAIASFSESVGKAAILGAIMARG